jgi:hypothetical protein
MKLWGWASPAKTPRKERKKRKIAKKIMNEGEIKERE